MDWGTIGVLATIVIGGFTLQTVWIGRLLDAFTDSMNQRFDRLEARLDRIEDIVLRDHGERIARLENAN